MACFSHQYKFPQKIFFFHFAIQNACVYIYIYILFSLWIFLFFILWLLQNGSNKCSSFLQRLGDIKSLFLIYFCYLSCQFLAHTYCISHISPVLFCLYICVWSWLYSAAHNNKVILSLQHLSIAQFLFWSLAQP